MARIFKSTLIKLVPCISAVCCTKSSEGKWRQSFINITLYTNSCRNVYVENICKKLWAVLSNVCFRLIAGNCYRIAQKWNILPPGLLCEQVVRQWLCGWVLQFIPTQKQFGLFAVIQVSKQSFYTVNSTDVTLFYPHWKQNKWTGI